MPRDGTGGRVTRCSDESQGHLQGHGLQGHGLQDPGKFIGKFIARSLADLRRIVVMTPALWWIAFWSLAMGAAACWCEQQPEPEPLRVRSSAKRRPE